MIKFAMCIFPYLFLLMLLFSISCHSGDAISKTVGPVAEPVVETTDDVFQKRTVQSKEGTGPKAVFFPDEPSDEVDEAGEHGTKQFKLEF